MNDLGELRERVAHTITRYFLNRGVSLDAVRQPDAVDPGNVMSGVADAAITEVLAALRQPPPEVVAAMVRAKTEGLYAERLWVAGIDALRDTAVVDEEV
ncbi:MAG: hypothetical protein GC201_10530 [Alphaproteobacteria bacterium]|nr:hypothetical protein [Alphaproteobacteria bacterium]